MSFLLASLLSLSIDTPTTAPRPVPAGYVVSSYSLTLQPPRGATYCPLPDDWTGSYHGTTFFLTPPTSCGGAGYPSTSRGWYGDPATPHITVGFFYNAAPEYHREPRCQPVARTQLAGREVSVCRSVRGRHVEYSLHGHYRWLPDSDALLDFTLTTTRARSGQDLRVLMLLAESVRICRLIDEDGGRSWGYGDPCPPDQYF